MRNGLHDASVVVHLLATNSSLHNTCSCNLPTRTSSIIPTTGSTVTASAYVPPTTYVHLHCNHSIYTRCFHCKLYLKLLRYRTIALFICLPCCFSRHSALASFPTQCRLPLRSQTAPAYAVHHAYSVPTPIALPYACCIS